MLERASLLAGFAFLLLAWILPANELVLLSIGVSLVAFAVIRLLARPRMSSNLPQSGRNQMRQDFANLMKDVFASTADRASKSSVNNALVRRG